MVLGASRRQHGEVALGETVPRALEHAVERVHEAVAEGVGVDVERRVDEVRDVGPVGFVTGHQGDGRAEALALHAHPDVADAVRR